MRVTVNISIKVIGSRREESDVRSQACTTTHTQRAWRLAFDDDANPSTAFVTVDPMALSGNYFINYYMPALSSSSSSSSASLLICTSSSSSGSGDDADIALFAASFCVMGGSSSSTSSLLLPVRRSSSSSGGVSSSSSSSGGTGPCNAYADSWLNAGNADSGFSYKITGTTFHGTNEQISDLNTSKTCTYDQRYIRGYKFALTPQQPLGVCIPSDGTPGEDNPAVSWTNFQSVLAAALPAWQFNYIGLTSPLPATSLKGRTYEVLLGKGAGFAKSKIAHFGVRLHQHRVLSAPLT